MLALVHRPFVDNGTSQYGKLSDIFGKKTMLIVAYVLFTVGCAIR